MNSIEIGFNDTHDEDFNNTSVCEVVAWYEKRLFYDEVLYCEGGHKPWLRGKLHMVWCLIAPYAAWRLYIECRGNLYKFGIGLVSLVANLWCFAWSATFHVGSWSKPVEIVLQKLDHCWISVWCVAMLFPTGLLILPRSAEYNGYTLGYALIGTASGFCCLNCWYVLRSEPSVWLHTLVPGSIVPFLPFMYWTMNQREWLYCWGVIVSMCCGTAFYAIKWDPSWLPLDIAGHHELLHLFSLIASTFVYLLSVSAIK